MVNIYYPVTGIWHLGKTTMPSTYLPNHLSVKMYEFCNISFTSFSILSNYILLKFNLFYLYAICKFFSAILKVDVILYIIGITLLIYYFNKFIDNAMVKKLETTFLIIQQVTNLIKNYNHIKVHII